MRTCILLFLVIVAGCAWAKDDVRNPNWATYVQIEGVPNLHMVSDSLYRSAQPNDIGMYNLEKLGIKKLINLRVFHSDKDEIEGTSLLNEELSVKTWHLEDEDVIRVLKIVSKSDGGPFLIHCQHGADRTGLMCAMYRIIIQGWSKEAAIDEMKNGGFGYHQIWSNIPKYIMNCDIDSIKRKLQE
jgi:protein tyrosine/serine phosphatase